MVKNPPVRDIRDVGSRRFPWRRTWQLTPIFLPGESHVQRSLISYSPEGDKELDMTEATKHAHMHKTTA